MTASRIRPHSRAMLIAVALGLCSLACFSSSQAPGPPGPPPSEGGPEGGSPPRAPSPDAGESPDKPPHQLCTADLQDFLAHGVRVEELEKKIEHGIELGVTSLPLLATPEELAQLREQGVPQELLDKWTSTTAGTAPAAPAAPAPAAPTPVEAPPPPEGAAP